MATKDLKLYAVVQKETKSVIYVTAKSLTDAKRKIKIIFVRDLNFQGVF